MCLDLVLGLVSTSSGLWSRTGKDRSPWKLEDEDAFSYTERSAVNTRMILGSRVSHFEVSLISEGRGVGCWCGRGW